MIVLNLANALCEGVVDWVQTFKREVCKFFLICLTF